MRPRTVSPDSPLAPPRQYSGGLYIGPLSHNVTPSRRSAGGHMSSAHASPGGGAHRRHQSLGPHRRREGASLSRCGAGTVLPHPTFRQLSISTEDEAGAANLFDEGVPQMTQLVGEEIALSPLRSLPAAGIEVVAIKGDDGAGKA